MGERERKPTGFEIAVIGMSGGFPGARDIDEFWNNLKNGVEAVSFLSDEELRKSGIKPGRLQHPDYVKSTGGWYEDKEYFDAFFFGYTPAEADVMDPHFRVFHQFCYNALANAGYDSAGYPGKIGLYAGFSSNPYWGAMVALSGKGAQLGGLAAAHLAGKEFLTTTISYKLDLKGPSLVVQTACSTSLSAIHLACRALLMAECDMAMAGGITISVQKPLGYLHREGMIDSRDGHCRAFDASASGTIRGEGVGVVVLKRLQHARADGDTIHAVVLGSAINNDGGRKTGYAAPSIEGQVEITKLVREIAQVEPESIGYVEAHGTATILGDPVEIEALVQAFDPDRKGSRACAVGSVKTNIGHLDAAAGVAGFIKAVLALKHKQIPPSLNYEKPNPKIDFENSPFYVNTRLTQWENNEYPLRAAVSSLGIGGTNAHVILEEAPPLENSSRSRPLQMIFLSAKTETALNRATRNLRDHLKEKPGINLADAAYTLQVGRAAFQYRKMLVCQNVDETIEALSSPDHEKVKIFQTKTETRRVIFMFPGQGTQYVNMGRELYENEPVFRDEMDRCFDILKPLTDYDLKDILYPASVSSIEKNLDSSPGISEGEGSGSAPAPPGQIEDELASGGPLFSKSGAKTFPGGQRRRGEPCVPPPARPESRIDQTGIAQPLIFAVEYALAKLLTGWGIEPTAMIGHSIGEYVAACLSGVFSLEDALRLVSVRGRLMQRQPGGAMLGVMMNEKELIPLLNKELSLAAVNGPNHCVVSGSYEAIRDVTRQLSEKGYKYTRLHTSHAFHSAMMEPAADEFAGQVERTRLHEPKIPYISNLTGKWTAVDDALTPRYWVDHLRKTVRFADGAGTLTAIKDAVFLELGPGKTLSTFVRQQADKNSIQPVLNLIRHPGEDVSDVRYLFEKTGQLWLYGTAPDWRKFYAAEKRHRITLPSYSFDGKSFWMGGDSFEIGARLLSGRGAGISGLSQPVESHQPPAGDSREDNSTRYSHRSHLSTPYAAPAAGTEQLMADTWQDFFGIRPIGTRDDFFELGGDSLKAVQLINILKKSGIVVTLDKIFSLPTIGKLCEKMTRKENNKRSRDYQALSNYMLENYGIKAFYKNYRVNNTGYRVLYIVRGSEDMEKLSRDLKEKFEDFYPNYIKFIESEEEIIKTGEIDARSFSTALGLVNRVTGQEKIDKELKKNSRLTSLLKKNKILRKYEVAPPQVAFLLNLKEIAGNNLIIPFDFTYPIEFEGIKKMVLEIINGNSLLRSMVVKHGGTYYIHEFDSYSNIRIPFIDLSGYSPDSREKIHDSIRRHLEKPIHVIKNVLYRAAAVKLNESHYKLVFQFNHLIFDGGSVLALQEQIDRIQKGTPPGNGTKIDYYDYATFLSGLTYENIHLDNYLPVLEYLKSLDKIREVFVKGEVNAYSFEIDLSILNDNSKHFYNEILFLCYGRLIGSLYEIDNVPLIFYSQGRNYKDRKFNDIIGTLQDFIPVSMHFDRDNGPNFDDLLKNFLDYRKYIKNSNLNFTNFVRKKYREGEEYLKLLSTPFKFNMQIGAYEPLKHISKDGPSGPPDQNRFDPGRMLSEMIASKDHHSDKVMIRFLHNTTFGFDRVKELFVKHFKEITQYFDTK